MNNTFGQLIERHEAEVFAYLENRIREWAKATFEVGILKEEDFENGQEEVVASILNTIRG